MQKTAVHSIIPRLNCKKNKSILLGVHSHVIKTFFRKKKKGGINLLPRKSLNCTLPLALTYVNQVYHTKQEYIFKIYNENKRINRNVMYNCFMLMVLSREKTEMKCEGVWLILSIIFSSFLSFSIFPVTVFETEKRREMEREM